MGTAAASLPETRSERRKRLTHERLLDATRELLLEEGPRGISSRAVAHRADVAVGTFYNHFEMVEDAIDEAVAPTREWALAHFERILAADSYEEAVAAWVADFLLRLEADGTEFQVARSANVHLLGSMETEIVEQMKERWGEQFTERGIAPGAAGPVMIKLMVMCGDLYGGRPMSEATADHLARMLHAANATLPVRLERQVDLSLEQWHTRRQDLETSG